MWFQGFAQLMFHKIGNDDFLVRSRVPNYSTVNKQNHQSTNPSTSFLLFYLSFSLTLSLSHLPFISFSLVRAGHSNLGNRACPVSEFTLLLFFSINECSHCRPARACLRPSYSFPKLLFSNGFSKGFLACRENRGTTVKQSSLQLLILHWHI